MTGSSLTSPSFRLAKQAFQGDAARGWRQLQAAFFLAAEVGDRARLRLLDSDLEGIAGVGKVVEARDLDRHGRRSFLDPLAQVVHQRPDAAPGGPADEDVADAEGAVLNQNRRDGTATRLLARLDDDALGLQLRVRPQFRDFRGQRQHLEQIVDSLALESRDGHRDHVAAPILDHQVAVRQLLLDPFDVGVRPVDLVDRDQDGRLGRAGVVERFQGLGHHAVVGGDDQDHHVRDLRAAGPELGERFVAGRVEEGDATVIVVDLVGGDVLRDAAELTLGQSRLANRVEQGRLAVVDVTHDRHDRRPLDLRRRLGAFPGCHQLLFLLKLDLLFEGDDQGVEAHLFRQLDRHFGFPGRGSRWPLRRDRTAS